MSHIVEVRNLTKHYPGFALRDVSLDVPAGAITGIFGPSGAGKTTLTKIIANQLPAGSGSVLLFGRSYRDAEKEIKNRTGYVGEEPLFYPGATVAWTTNFLAPLFKQWDGARFARFLDQFGIDRRRRIRELSRGRKTLLSIAVALSHEADLLILDEPTAGLDMVIRRDVLDLLRDFVAEGERAVIISSHVTDALADVSDYVAILSDGELLLHTEKDELLSDWKRIHFKDGALDPGILETLTAVESRGFGNSGLTGRYREIGGRLTDAVQAGDVRVQNVGLDDVLIALVKGD